MGGPDVDDGDDLVKVQELEEQFRSMIGVADGEDDVDVLGGDAVHDLP